MPSGTWGRQFFSSRSAFLMTLRNPLAHLPTFHAAGCDRCIPTRGKGGQPCCLNCPGIILPVAVDDMS